MPKAPTIRSLAKLAGVSKATVSLALRDNPRIRACERERIQRIAKEAGYEPNPLMAHLLTQLRSGEHFAYHGTIGLVYVTRTTSELMEVATFTEWFTACRARARQLGYSLDEFMLYEPGMTPARLVQILDARNIRGLVVIGPFEHSTIPREFDPVWARSAAVVIGTRPVQPALSCAANDQFSTAKQAVLALRELGYRRPGLCLNAEIGDHVEGRFQGGFHVVEETLPASDQLPVFDFQAGKKEAFTRWVATHRPDAILTLHYQIKEWIEAMGLRVPEDVALAHLDREPDRVEWAGMRQNNEAVGYAAIDLVIGQLHRGEVGVPPFQKCTFTNSVWTPGATVRATPAGARLTVQRDGIGKPGARR